MDWNTLDEVAVTAIVSAGPTTGTFATYSTIVEQMQTQEYRKDISKKLNKLSELEIKLGQDVSPEMREIYTDQYKEQIEEISNSHNGLEVDALAVGAKNVQKLLKASVEETFLNQMAGVNPNDNRAVINAKRESYINSLSKQEAKEYQDKLNSIKDVREKITDNIDYNGVAEKAFGDRGLYFEEKLKNNPEYKLADKRGKLVMILNAVMQ